MKKALIIVDVQNDFLPNGNLAVGEGDQIIPFVTDLMTRTAHYELIVATQDWHPTDHGSFASTHPGAKSFDVGELGGLEQVFWPDHCVQGEEGARIHRDILHQLIKITETGQRTLIIKKGQHVEVDSYSAFFDNARRHDTGLQRALQSYEIEEIDVVGLAFDYCVKFTALDAASLGYETRVLLQGTRPVNPAAAEATISELETAGVRCQK
ncbi:MAG: bifunctional nicotinamidase/pyrazinamidase [Desulfocapsaceae bacterium]